MFTKRRHSSRPSPVEIRHVVKAPYIHLGPKICFSEFILHKYYNVQMFYVFGCVINNFTSTGYAIDQKVDPKVGLPTQATPQLDRLTEGTLY
jgi:hypothetical protein